MIVVTLSFLFSGCFSQKQIVAKGVPTKELVCETQEVYEVSQPRANVLGRDKDKEVFDRRVAVYESVIESYKQQVIKHNALCEEVNHAR